MRSLLLRRAFLRAAKLAGNIGGSLLHLAYACASSSVVAAACIHFIAAVIIVESNDDGMTCERRAPLSCSQQAWHYEISSPNVNDARA